MGWMKVQPACAVPGLLAAGQQAFGQDVHGHALQAVVVELEQPGGVRGISRGANLETDPIAALRAVGQRGGQALRQQRDAERGGGGQVHFPVQVNVA